MRLNRQGKPSVVIDAAGTNYLTYDYAGRLLSTYCTNGLLAGITPYQELLKKSDLVVIAAPAATDDTTEHIDLPGFPGEHVIGVETRFTVSAVFQGDKAVKAFVLPH